MGNPISCIKSTEYSIHTRRCFITGEYCSQQTNIQKERQRLHERNSDKDCSGGEINAFVVMNFSSVSDVLYEARMIPFIESLKKYLFLDKEGKRIACISSGELGDLDDNTIDKEDYSARWKPVSRIHVHRADSNPVSNYIICNRICQQMQMADLIIVDVSVESANVFYEFGLATAFQKLILPICFSDSFYAKKLPEKLEQMITQADARIMEKKPPKRQKESPRARFRHLENHIDCYPWRRKLFEHFGIRHHEKGDPVRYQSFNTVTAESYGFSDIQYRHFPYSTKKEGDTHEVGWKIYRALQLGFTPKDQTDNNARYDTVLLYTMSDFMEKSRAGACIVNFYNNITKPMHDKFCFCGDRVAVLGRPNKIWDDPKDSQTASPQQYRVCDLIAIGMDRATYQAERKRIKTNDYLTPPIPETETEKSSAKDAPDLKEARRLVKSHIRNRSISLYPDNPVYVTQYKQGIQKELDEEFKRITQADQNEKTPSFFCLYHVMLETLQYANELVVDLSSNSIQAMFWLGAAHGSDVYAVTVRHETTEQEKKWSDKDISSQDRPIFDIGGLWTAMLHYGEMDSFYRQLELIQQGIDQHARLKLPQTELDAYEYEVFRQLYHASPFLKYGKEQLLPDDRSELEYLKNYDRINAIHSELAEKNRTESLALESYYRDRFWRQLLRDNQLHLFLPLNDASDQHGPRLQIIKWDMDTVAELSHYLSKRKVIGRYQFDTLRKDEYYGKGGKGKKAEAENFIVIGSDARPFAPENAKPEGDPRSLAEWILSQHNHDVRRMEKWIRVNKERMPVSYRGFLSEASGSWGAQYLDHECIQCTKCTEKSSCRNRANEIQSVDPHNPPIITPNAWNKALNGLPEKLVLAKNPDRSVFSLTTDGPGTDMPDIPCGSYFYFEPGAAGQPIMRLCARDMVGAYGFPANGAMEEYNDVSRFFPETLTLEWSREHCVCKTSPDTHTADFHQLLKHVLVFNNRGELVPRKNLRSCGYRETSHSQVEYKLPAQLLLWREPQESTASTRAEYKYHVSLVGVSGPATKALTALLVDDEQKWGIWGNGSDGLSKDLKDHLSRYLPLNTLQTSIRRKFFERLSNEVFPDGQKDQQKLQQAWLLCAYYLSTLLPQYFLPFLSRSDEKRIYNALKAFLRITDSRDTELFDPALEEYSDIILNALEKTLSGFRGVDALYEVEVSTASGDKDVRNIRRISLLMNKSKPVINCLYVDGDATRKEQSDGE